MPTESSSQAQPRTHSGNPLAVHRCRFLDYNPAAITAIAFPSLKLPSSGKSASSKYLQRERSGKFGPLAVGRSNGNIELYEWAIPSSEQGRTPKAPQAWVLKKILYGPNPSKVDSLALTLRHPHLLEYNEVPGLACLRLFSTGGGSELLEWDAANGTVLRTLNSQGGAIWSMAANAASTRLALGCEDGCVRLIDISDGEMSHLRRFDRIKSRILCIAWGPPVPPSSLLSIRNAEIESDDEDEDDEWVDGWLVTGGSDSSLRKWDVKTGRVMDRMSTDKARDERTLVWAVGVFADGTIVSGDSLGMVKFWDSRTCTQLHSFPAHGADVLCIAIGPDGNSVFTSGVDQKVSLFTHVKVSEAERSDKGAVHKFKSRWVQSTSKRMHSHDVRALAVWPPYQPISASARPPTSTKPNPFSKIAPVLVSGGLDASLVLTPCATAGSADQQMINPLATSAVSTFEDAYHRRISYPTGLSPAISVARTARLVVCRRDTSLSIWRVLGRARIPSTLEADLRAAEAMDVDSTGTESAVQGQKHNEQCGYEKLLDMELDTTTNLSSSAVSDDGHWLVVSDAYEIKLFELLADTTTNTVRPRRVKSFMVMLSAYLSQSPSPGRELEGASVLDFAPDGCRLVLALMRSALVLVIDLTDRRADGRPEPRVLRKFEHHARRGALFVHGRVVRGTPGSINGDPQVNGAANSHASDSGNDNLSEEDVAMAEDQNTTKKTETANELDGDEGNGGHALVTRIAFSPDGQWFATSDDQYRTHIFNLDAIQHHTVLPTSPALITALAFSSFPSSVFSSATSPASTLLVLSHADSTIGVFDVETRRFAPWAEHLAQREHLPRRWTNLHDSVLGIAVEPPSSNGPTENGRHALFWGATWLCRIELDAPVGWGGFVRKRRRDEPLNARSKAKSKAKDRTGARSAPSRPANEIAAGGTSAEPAVNLDADDDDETMSNFKLVSRFRPILKVDFLDASELLVIERPLVDVLRGLPPAFFKPRYGT